MSLTSTARYRSHKAYTPAEDDTIRELKGENKPWKAISAAIPDRTVASLTIRYYNHLRQNAEK